MSLFVFVGQWFQVMASFSIAASLRFTIREILKQCFSGTEKTTFTSIVIIK